MQMFSDTVLAKISALADLKTWFGRKGCFPNYIARLCAIIVLYSFLCRSIRIPLSVEQGNNN